MEFETYTNTFGEINQNCKARAVLELVHPLFNSGPVIILICATFLHPYLNKDSAAKMYLFKLQNDYNLSNKALALQFLLISPQVGAKPLNESIGCINVQLPEEKI